MKLNIRDGIATVLLAAILVPYVGYLAWGDVPFIQDPRGMSAVGLILGAAMFLTAGRFTWTFAGKVEIGAGIVALAMGVIALLLAETGVAELLLAVFMATIVVTWAVQMLHHAGLLSGSAPTALPHR